MEEIRRRAGADDKPLCMVKTVLHELVKLHGTAIKGHLSMVPIDMEPQPIIFAYIDLNLQTLAAARMLTPTGAKHIGVTRLPIILCLLHICRCSIEGGQVFIYFYLHTKMYLDGTILKEVHLLSSNG
ncbi:hypothetical protein L1987_42435 [Smallanthus sonchifolius]|uniref:Uncharacterized protein n=1 Tax=Smallanthus sonchifolius TaxID=185202 RepID=A0ACB9GK34_9ASTR|nr:hypothetical protein L1987_42435 [Smallanthus sonchifolius]